VRHQCLYIASFIVVYVTVHVVAVLIVAVVLSALFPGPTQLFIVQAKTGWTGPDNKAEQLLALKYRIFRLELDLDWKLQL